MSGFRISPLQPRTAGNLKGFGFTIEFSHSSTVHQAPLSVDEKSRDAALPSVSAPSAGQE